MKRIEKKMLGTRLMRTVEILLLTYLSIEKKLKQNVLLIIKFLKNRMTVLLVPIKYSCHVFIFIYNSVNSLIISFSESHVSI